MPHISRGVQAIAMRKTSAALRVGIAVITIFLALLILFRWDKQLHSLEDTGSRVLLSLLGLSICAWILRVLAAGARKLRKTTLFGTLAVIISQICYHGLVWFDLKREEFAWRAWWMSLLVAILTTHLVWLHFVGDGQKTWRRFAITCACVACAMWTIICLGRTPLPDLPAWYLLVAGAFTAMSSAASIVIWLRMRRKRGFKFALTTKLSIAAVAQAIIVAIAFYAGRITAPSAGSIDATPSLLATMSRTELSQQMSADLNRLRAITRSLDELSLRAGQDIEQIEQKRKTENRTYFRPAEEDCIRAHFMSYLACRTALLRLAATYQNYPTVTDPDLRARCFLIAFTAGGNVFESSLRLVRAYREDVTARTKLNEPDAASALPAGMFDRIEEAVSSDRNAEMFAGACRYFDDNADRWRRDGVIDAEMNWLDDHANRSKKYVSENAISPDRTAMLARRFTRDVYAPYYSASSLISTWIGDTRLVARAPFISEGQIALMKNKLQPGDIFLERRNWFASNAFLPGFWPHAALYLGTIRDLERLGLVHKDAQGKWTSDDPNIRDRLAEYLKPAEDGAAHTVMESVSEGVIFNSLEESMHADYVAVLRPRLTDQQKAQALTKAFSHQGKPYDFEFDFFSADKLVCTELVYRSYEGLLHFELVKIMGRDTLPAMEICKKFSAERSQPDDKRQLDFVMFLDAAPSDRTTKLASEDDFCRSASRPRGFNE